jgi:hypothetical protein
MGGTGRCCDSARMESFFATLKKEKLYQLQTGKMPMAKAKSVVFRYIMTYYNRERIYTANSGGLTPAMYRQAARGLAASSTYFFQAIFSSSIKIANRMNGIFVLGVKFREGWVFQQRSALDTVISKSAFQSVNRSVQLLHTDALPFVVEQVGLCRDRIVCKLRNGNPDASDWPVPAVKLLKQPE